MLLQEILYKHSEEDLLTKFHTPFVLGPERKHETITPLLRKTKSQVRAMLQMSSATTISSKDKLQPENDHQTVRHGV